MLKNIKIRLLLVLSFFLILLPMVVIGYFLVSRINLAIVPLGEETTNRINNLAESSRLDSVAQFIRYYDEVLTQSARNYAFTGNKEWKIRYEETEPKLDKFIKEAIEKGDERDRVFFSNIDEANLKLVEMEYASIALVDDGKSNEAINILESEEYWQQKNIYKKGLEEYVEKRDIKYDEALTVSTKNLRDTILKGRENLSITVSVAIVVTAVTTILSIFLVSFIIFFIFEKLRKIKVAVSRITKGDLGFEIDLSPNNEIGQIAQAFNLMTREIKKNRMETEKEIKKRTEELEKVNKSLIGRELKMIKLKNKIRILENK